jgi:hypothetical protein
VRVLAAPARWLERSKGRRRKALAGCYCLIVAALGATGWRVAQLNGLPDIGEPFDARPLLALRVPDESNAFVLYAKASAHARRNWGIERRLGNFPYAWPKPTDSEGLAYMAENADALALWRRGCELGDALYVSPAELTFATRLPLLQDHRHFVRLALVEASRVEAAGDQAGAWGWYRAIVRGSRLLTRHATMIGVLVGISELAAAQARIGTWAADPRVDAALLRRALDDLLAADTLAAPFSESLQIEYLTARKAVDQPAWFVDQVKDQPWDWGASIDMTSWYNHLPAYWQARWFLTNEPERSRRLLKLAMANWLVECDSPAGQRPALVGKKDAAARFYNIARPAGVPTAAALAARVESNLLLSPLLFSYPSIQRAVDRDRRRRAGLILLLANHLYERRFGKPPAVPEDLLGTCLDRFPDGYVRVDEEGNAMVEPGR